MSTGPKLSPELLLSDVAREHQVWLASKGEQGRRANFDGLNLWGIKFRSLTPTHNFTAALFGSAQLFRADLRGCNLQFANFRDTTGLSSEFLAGSDLSGASLPELLGWAGELELLRSKESVAQSLFLSMLAATIYIILAVIDTNDLALITNSTTLSLPILNTSVPVIPFYVVAPVVLCVVFIYFCFLQRETIDLLRRMPLVMPDGSMPATKAFSWLPLDDGHLLSPHKPHRSLLGSAISAVVAYGAVPLALLCIWERGLVARDTKLTVLHVVLFAVATGFCWYLLYFPARSGGVRRRSRKWGAVLTASAISAIAYLSLAVLKGGPFPRSEYLGSVLSIKAVHDGYDSVSYYYDRNDSEQERAWGVPGRRWFHLLRLDPYPNLNGARSPVEGSDSADTGGGLAFPSGWTQRHLPAQNSRLQSAYMTNCDLEGADLRRALLSRANLTDCHLEGATLSRAKIDKANLSGTTLDRAILTGADLSGTDLSETSFNEVVAEEVVLSGAHLNDVPLRGAFLSRARMDGADLTNADLTNAHMDGIILTKADLTSAHLNGADLHDATINTSSLQSAIFKNANLTDASLAGSDLTGSDLSCTKVGGAHFAGSDLSNADLTGMMNRRHDPRPYEPADFSVRTMAGANLYGANLKSATGLSAKQVKAAKNWTEAFYGTEFLQQLGLPANHNEQLEVKLSQDKFCQSE